MNRFVFRAAVLCAIAGGCWAQFSASVQGKVQDPSGGSVSGANVEIVNTATGVRETSTSDSSGAFRFVSLAPGKYDITVASPGFAKVQVPVTITTGQVLNVPINLQLAAATTTVEVTGAAPVIDTADTRNQQTIQSAEVAALPLSGRNMVNLVTLAPGVSGRGLSALGSPGSAADNFATEQQVDASANGRSSNANMFIVDGLDVTSNIRPGVLNLTPNPDTIQEATTAVNTFSVEYGRGSSLVYTMTTKSGTDKFHGLASDYFTYQKFWAGTEFTHNYLPFHSNNMSATLGGPIVPHHQFFFFFAIEPLRASSAAVNTTTVEDPAFVAWAQGAFPNSLGTKLLTTYTPNGGTRTGIEQTAAEYFGSSLCGPASTVAALTTLACSTPVIDNAVQSLTNYRNGLQWNVRIDKYWQADRIYGNYFQTTLDTGGPNIRTAFNTTSHYVTKSLELNETHTLSPTTLNEAQFAYLRVEGISPQTGLFSVPTINVNGVAGFGDGFALGDFVQHSYHWRDMLTHIQGAHTLRFGYDGWHGDDLAYFAGTHDQPSFQFNNLLQLVEDQPYSESSLAYNPVTGQPAQGNYGYQSTTAGLFAQDTWKPLSNLTLVYGLRWDDFGNPYPALKGTVLANFHLGSGGTFDEQVATGYMKQQQQVLNRPIWNVWSPRIGVAWDPTKKGDWVIRGGFGIYHDMPTLGNMENGLNANPPGYIVPTFFSGGGTAAPIFALGNSNKIPFGFPYPAFQGSPLNAQGGITGSQASVGGVDVNLTAPTTLNYAVNVEHKLIGSLVADIGYAGSHSYNLITGYGQTGNTSYGIDINRFAGDLLIHNSTTPTRLNHSFGAINYAENAAVANYNALVTDVHAQLPHGVYFEASYTHSRSLDDTQVYPTFGNFRQYYDPSAWDAPDRFSLAFNVPLPSFENGKGLLGRVLSGWSISGTSVAQNGNPFTIFTTQGPSLVNGVLNLGGDYNADGFNYDYPNVASYRLPDTRRAFLNGLIPSGFITTPPPGQEGNEKPNQYRDPPFFETDASLLKDTRILERVSLQLRFEFYNLFNYANLNGIDSNLADGTFGKSTSQANPRWMQLGARLTF